MLILNIVSSTAVSADSPIPLILEKNTNGNVIYKDGVITFMRPGYYRFEGILNMSGISSNMISAFVFNGTEEITQTISSADISGTSASVTLPICATVDVEPADETEFATASIQVDVAANILNANLTVSYMG